MIWSAFCVMRVKPAGISNKLESSDESEYEMTSMVISIKEPGVDGGGGFWLFWSAVSSCFFFFANNPPRLFVMAPLMLVGMLSEFEEEEVGEEAEVFDICTVFPDESCAAMDIDMYWRRGKPFRLPEFFWSSSRLCDARGST